MLALVKSKRRLQRAMSYKIGEVAKLAKVSVKTLHHYDAIGLLAPTGRSESGYRLYSEKDLSRLQQILFYRELEFSLETIHQIMTAPEFEELQALRKQKAMLEAKQDKLGDVIGLIEKTINIKEEGSMMELKEMFEVFPEIDKDMVAEEERRWGHTEAHRESMRRAKHYKKEDWEQMKKERDVLYEQMKELFNEDLPVDDPRVLEIVDQQRLLIEKWHYPCSKEFFVKLTEMTSSDEMYVKVIDEECPGLASYTHLAARALHEAE